MKIHWRKEGEYMKIRNILAISILTFSLLSSMAACGNKNTDAAEQSAEEAQQAIIQQATDQQATVEQALEKPDSDITIDKLIGSWVDVTSPDRFVNITKVGEEYQYEDNEGKLPATFTDGVLKVKISDTDTADVYIDTKTDHLLCVYQDNISEFAKK
jgi:hypothetical protein